MSVNLTARLNNTLHYIIRCKNMSFEIVMNYKYFHWIVLPNFTEIEFLIILYYYHLVFTRVLNACFY